MVRSPSPRCPRLGRLLTGLLLAVGALLLAGAGTVLLAPAASAGDGGAGGQASALAQLTPAERRALVGRVPGWEKLPRARREKIAANVLELRRLSPEDRARFVERIRAIERHRSRTGRLPGGFSGARNPKRREEMRRRTRFVHAVGVAMQSALSPDVRQRLERWLERGERVRLESAFVQRLWDLQVRQMAAGDLPPLQLPTDMAASRRQRVEELQAKAAGGDETARRKVARLVLGQEVREFARDLGAGARDDPSVLREVGRRVQARYPEAFAAAVGELETAARGPEALRRYLRRGRSPTGPDDAARGRVRLEKLLRVLREARSALAQDPVLEATAAKLERMLGRALRLGGEGRDAGGGRRPGRV
ncbi:MAG: DUF3106 domain-containing protein, partial [Planctomycetota bacterium]